MNNIPSPVYPSFVLQDRQLLADIKDHVFILPELEDAKSLRKGDLAKVVGYVQNRTDNSFRCESIWLQVESALSEYGMYIGQVISPVFVETVLDSKISYLPFYPENVAEIFGRNSKSQAVDAINKLLD